MAAQDVDAKNVLVYYMLPFVVFLFVIRIFAKNMKSFKRRLTAWLANKLLKRLHKKLQKEKDVMFAELKTIGRNANRRLEILEIGSGSGMNFKYYPKGAEIICLDPNPYNKTYIEENLHEINPEVRLKKFVVGFAEDMPQVEDSSCDAVVCTLVLCTVRDVSAVLKEVRRVLKPNGVFFFLEHVASKRRTFKRRVQNFLNPLWKVMCDGCNINRETWNIINSSGFSKTNQSQFVLKMFKLGTPCVYGQAVK